MCLDSLFFEVQLLMRFPLIVREMLAGQLQDYSAYKFFSKMSLQAGGNAGLFLPDCLASPKPESKKNDDLGDPGAQFSSHFAAQMCPGASMCPRSGPK